MITLFPAMNRWATITASLRDDSPAESAAQPIDQPMSEQAPKDQTPEQPEDAQSDGNAEDDLEALLAEASSLAGELSDETGTPSAPDPAPEPILDPAVESGEIDPTTEQVAEGEPASDEASEPASDSMPEPAPEPVVDPAEHVETQLAELEELASTIGEEIGAGADDKHDAPNEAPNEAANATQDEAASGQAIATDPPDFMKEFTDADVPSLDDPDDESTPSSPSHPATSSAGTLSAADAEAVGIVPPRSLPPTSGAESESPATPTASDGVNADTPSRANRIRGSIIASPALLGVGTLGATLLELADKPFGRLGQKVRILIGWVAIATVATSLLVFAVSLF